MNKQVKLALDDLAERIVARDFHSAHASLAPWMRDAVQPQELERMLDDFLEGLRPPGKWSVDGGMLEVEDLGRYEPEGPVPVPVSTEITKDNYRGWWVIQFAPAVETDDQNACYDMWVALVEVDGAYRVGYVEIAGSD